MAIKLKYKEVVERFKKGECELLEDKYINSRTKMKYKCECENISYITLDNFRGGARCRKCMGSRISHQTKTPTYKIKQIFRDNGCKMLGDYKGANIPIKYKCECGNMSKIFVGNLKKGQRCRKCGTEKRIASTSYKHSEIKTIFENAGCKLLSKNYTPNQKLKYKCSCDNISEILLPSFLQGHRCKKCGVEKQKVKVLGKKHWNYNSNLTEVDRQRWRWYCLPEYIEWRKAVFGRDRYRCQCCKEKAGSLNAHHKESFNNNPGLRVDIDNGITLCENCHGLFHNIYGKGNNTISQLEVFLCNYGGDCSVGFSTTLTHSSLSPIC